MKPLLISLLLLALAGCQNRRNSQLLSSITDLPSFKIISLDSSKLISTEDISVGQPLIFIYFNPDCDICQQEIKELVKHQKELSQAQIYLLTDGRTTDVNIFTKTLHLDTLKNLFIGRDYKFTFSKIFSPTSVPFIVIYSNKNKLKKIFLGNTNIKLIINAIR